MSDRYTKCLLTVIALCLIWMSLGGPAFLPTAHAQPGETEVVVIGWKDSKGEVWKLPSTAYIPPANSVLDQDRIQKQMAAQRAIGLRLPVGTD